MSRPKNIKTQILQLSKDGKSYSEICSILNCSRGTLSYHLSKNGKIKSKQRTINFRTKSHPFLCKMQRFQNESQTNQKTFKYLRSKRKMITDKISDFCNRTDNNEKHFTIDDVIKKFGENPKCYLTGELINIYEPKTYNFDHIIPVSRGGDNSIDNLGICTKQANMSKNDMTPTELIEFCKKVLLNNNFSINKV